MKGEWCYWMNYFSKETCDNIISLALELPGQNPTIGEDNNAADPLFRRSIVRFLSKSDPRYSWIHDELWKMLISVNKEWFGFNVNSLPDIQFTEYDESDQGFYDTHQDVSWVTNNNTHRKVSIVVQLSDPEEYEGGNFEFAQTGSVPPVDDIRKQGTFIAFPAFIRHRATPVTKGKRYSLVAWFEGPKFT